MEEVSLVQVMGNDVVLVVAMVYDDVLELGMVTYGVWVVVMVIVAVSVVAQDCEASEFLARVNGIVSLVFLCMERVISV